MTDLSNRNTKKAAFLCASAALWFLIASSLAGQMAPRDSSVSAALAELNKGRVLESIEQFKEILRSEPTNSLANFYLSSLYTEMGELDLAERYLNRAMEANPGQGLHYYQLGLIRYRQKQWRAGLGFFQEALQLGGGNSEAAVWRSIGDVQLELFDRDSARQAYETALQIQPHDAATQLALGRFYLERNEPDRAIQHLRAAIEFDPSTREAYPVLGRAYRQIGDLQSSMAILKKSLDADPADQESRYALGQILLTMGHVNEGRAELANYEKIRQQIVDANSKYETAVSLIEASQFPQAERLLREAVRLAPTYGPALHSLGSLLLSGGSAGNAVDFLKRAVEANPLNDESWFSLGTAYFKSGKLPEALQAARRAIVLNEEHDQYHRLVNEIQSRMKR